MVGGVEPDDHVVDILKHENNGIITEPWNEILVIMTLEISKYYSKLAINHGPSFVRSATSAN